MFGTKLRLRGQGLHRSFARNLRIPNTLFGLLAPMARNVEGARTVARAHQASRGLPVAPALQPALPPAQPAFALESPKPELAPVVASLASPQSELPPINAPGYASVPPASQTAAPKVRPGIPPTPLRSFTPRPPTS
jgi:hypothetical protein